MNTYTIQIQPVLQFPSLFTQQALEEVLEDVTVRELTETAQGSYKLDLRLKRADHYEALNDIFLAAQQLGYSIVEATVTEWVDQAVESAIVGLLSGGALGSASENPEIALVAALIGGLAGAVAGSRVRKVKIAYQVVPRYPSGWTLKEIPQKQPSGQGFQPGFSPS
jgi:hypothetical protein